MEKRSWEEPLYLKIAFWGTPVSKWHTVVLNKSCWNYCCWCRWQRRTVPEDEIVLTFCTADGVVNAVGKQDRVRDRGIAEMNIQLFYKVAHCICTIFLAHCNSIAEGLQKDSISLYVLITLHTQKNLEIRETRSCSENQVTKSVHVEWSAGGHLKETHCHIRGNFPRCSFTCSLSAYPRSLYPGLLIGYHALTSSMTVSHRTVHLLMTANFMGGYTCHPQPILMGGSWFYSVPYRAQALPQFPIV